MQTVARAIRLWSEGMGLWLELTVEFGLLGMSFDGSYEQGERRELGATGDPSWLRMGSPPTALSNSLGGCGELGVWASQAS